MQQHIGWIATVVNHSTQFDWLEAHTVLFFFFFLKPAFNKCFKAY